MKFFTKVNVNSARIFVETRSVEVDFHTLFTDTEGHEVNNCFTIPQQNKNDQKITKIF
jgi:hypothetical protein